MKEVDFEMISDIFQDFFKIDSLSHCDKMEFEDSFISLIEYTNYTRKDLLDKNVYEKELSEIVKKMWGTHSILIWYLVPDAFKKEKIFIIRAKIDKRFAKIIGKLNQKLRKFKNGAYTDINFDLS